MTVKGKLLAGGTLAGTGVVVWLAANQGLLPSLQPTNDDLVPVRYVVEYNPPQRGKMADVLYHAGLSGDVAKENARLTFEANVLIPRGGMALIVAGKDAEGSGSFLKCILYVNGVPVDEQATQEEPSGGNDTIVRCSAPVD